SARPGAAAVRRPGASPHGSVAAAAADAVLRTACTSPPALRRRAPPPPLCGPCDGRYGAAVPGTRTRPRVRPAPSTCPGPGVGAAEPPGSPDAAHPGRRQSQGRRQGLKLAVQRRSPARLPAGLHVARGRIQLGRAVEQRPCNPGGHVVVGRLHHAEQAEAAAPFGRRVDPTTMTARADLPLAHLVVVRAPPRRAAQLLTV